MKYAVWQSWLKAIGHQELDPCQYPENKQHSYQNGRILKAHGEIHTVIACLVCPKPMGDTGVLSALYVTEDNSKVTFSHDYTLNV